MRVLVTGSGGHVGSAVVRALAAADHEPVAMAHSDAARIPADVEVRAADLCDPESLASAVAGGMRCATWRASPAPAIPGDVRWTSSR